MRANLGACLLSAGLLMFCCDRQRLAERKEDHQAAVQYLNTRLRGESNSGKVFAVLKDLALRLGVRRRAPPYRLTDASVARSLGITRPTFWTSPWLVFAGLCDSRCRSDSHCRCVQRSSSCRPSRSRRLQMQHRPPRPSPPGGSSVAPRLAAAVLAAVVALAAVVPLAAVVALVVVFAMTLAAPSQS
jgi:hypothetical protein